MAVGVVLLAGAVLIAGPSVGAPSTDRALEQRLTPPPGPQEQIPPELQPAVDALTKGNVDSALTIARTFVKSQPGSAVGHEILGEAARRRGLWSEAEQALTEALRLEPGRVSALLKLGLVALGSSDAPKAEQRFRQAVAMAPKSEPVHLFLAVALARQGKFAAAIPVAEEALRLSGGRDVDAKFVLAGFYFEVGRLAESEYLLDQVLAVQPESNQVLLFAGLVKLDLGKTDEASVLLERLAVRDPQSLWARLGRAIVQRNRGQLAQARVELETLVKVSPDWPLAHLHLGQTLLMQRQRDLALKAFEQAERTSKDYGYVRLRVARILLAGGYPDPAIERAQSLLSNPAVAPAARGLLVQAYLARKEPEQAERVLRDAVGATRDDTTAVLQLGQFYLTRGRPREALAQFDRAATIRPDAPQPQAGRAEAYAALNEPGPSVAAAERFVVIQGQSPDSLLFLATINQRLGRNADAEKAYRQALAKAPKHLGAMLRLAALYDRMGRSAEAVKLLDEAAAAHPESTLPYLDLGAMLQRNGRDEAAISAYREGLRRGPDDPLLLNNLAYVLAQTPSSLPEAATLSERAYKRAPRNAAIVDTHGWILYQQGSADRALPLLEEAARLAPSTAEIQYHLGVVYAHLGRRAEARRALEQALRAPRFAQAGEARKLLESLQ
jgi:tetratricopeptide (TPR) repeat protein